MKLNAKAFGIAAGLTAAAVSAVCAIFVALAPDGATALFSNVVHADLTGLARTVTWGNFFAGVLFWSVGAGLVFWFAGWLYNRLSSNEARSKVDAAVLLPRYR
ncbi:MAG TPA: DUF5676 family membrane protein [Gemmatimonadales bacterium]|nr:DUF5676 family membrane protein [Gemmatimonadales bacterium]